MRKICKIFLGFGLFCTVSFASNSKNKLERAPAGGVLDNIGNKRYLKTKTLDVHPHSEAGPLSNEPLKSNSEFSVACDGDDILISGGCSSPSAPIWSSVPAPLYRKSGEQIQWTCKIGNIALERQNDAWALVSVLCQKK